MATAGALGSDEVSLARVSYARELTLLGADETSSFTGRERR